MTFLKLIIVKKGLFAITSIMIPTFLSLSDRFRGNRPLLVERNSKEHDACCWKKFSFL